VNAEGRPYFLCELASNRRAFFFIRPRFAPLLMGAVEGNQGSKQPPVDLLQGLQGPQKSVPCRFLYDEEGSRLYEEITGCADYYPYLAELRLFQEHVAGMLKVQSMSVCQPPQHGIWVYYHSCHEIKAIPTCAPSPQ
jgi:hypothetical protein